MRPVNLIPPEERRGQRAPMRGGPLAYVVVGVLALALAAVTVLVLTGNTISERKAELATLEAEEAAAIARAEALRPYADFAALEQSRQATVTTLSQSRFDWERVLRELAIVIPSDVWLTEMTGTVTPDVELDGGAEVDIRDSVEGPALEIIGCGASHTSVARFVEALKDIDGVTRVSVAESLRPEPDSEQQAPAASSTDTTDDCRTRDTIPKFQIVAAFDAVALPTQATAATGSTAATGTTSAPSATPAPDAEAPPAEGAATDASASASARGDKPGDAPGGVVAGAVR